jgi:hypothetical protein
MKPIHDSDREALLTLVADEVSGGLRGRVNAGNSFSVSNDWHMLKWRRELCVHIGLMSSLISSRGFQTCRQKSFLSCWTTSHKQSSITYTFRNVLIRS